MGRPTAKPLPKAPSRRDFFRRAGGGAALLAAAPLLSAHAASAAGAVFQHGVASGDPLADRVILWTRVTPPAPMASVQVAWQLAYDPDFLYVVKWGRTLALAARDHTVKLDITGLLPGQTYYYRFIALEQTSPAGRTRSLPVEGQAQHLRLAVASCSNHAAGLFNAYRRIAERADLDLVLHLGDYLYEYGSGQYGNLRPTEPATEIITLTDYRTRHAQYKADADLQELHRQHPVVPIWDDHETANDAWKGGAENHDPATEGLWAVRRRVALQAYYEWMPVREPADRRQPQRSFRLGGLAEITMLEQRLSGRSKQLPATIPIPGLGQGFTASGRFLDPERSLLGAGQEAWLASTLAASPARWKLIGQGVMFAQLKALGRANAEGGGLFVNPDQWDGYPPCRDRVFDMIDAAGGNVVVLTGDIHSAWANDLARDPNNPDVAAGGYDKASGAGSRAVEFVATSITSPGLPDPDGAVSGIVFAQNPHIKHIDLDRRGYLLLDLKPERVVGEFWVIDTVAAPSSVQTLGAAWEVRDGTNRLAPSAQTPPKANPPAPAP
jgi:alkaline phosphatase D